MDRLIAGIKPFEQKVLEHGTYIVMLRALNKPPHFLLLIDGGIFGISVKGSSIEVPVSQYYHWIERRKVKTLWFQLKVTKNVKTDGLIKTIKKHPIVNDAGITCLQPIKCFVEEYYGMDTSGVYRIFDLLDLLEEGDYLESVYESNIHQRELSIEEYTEQDIQKGIIKAMQKHLYARK